MAWLRRLSPASLIYTGIFRDNCLPAKSLWVCTIFFHLAAESAPPIRLVEAMAPGLTKGIDFFSPHPFNSSDGIENLTGCIHANLILKSLVALFLNHFCHGKYLGNTLDGNL